MNRFAMAAALVLAMSAAARAQNWARNYDTPDGLSDAQLILANAPGGDYIQCDPRNPSSPVRCKADGW